MLFADDVVLVGESLEEVNYRLEEWKEALETKGLKLVEVKLCILSLIFILEIRVNQNRHVVNMVSEVVDKVDSFKYLGSVLQKNGRFDKDIMHRIKCGWMKWREASSVLCDRRIPIRLKSKFYKADDDVWIRMLGYR